VVGYRATRKSGPRATVPLHVPRSNGLPPASNGRFCFYFPNLAATTRRSSLLRPWADPTVAAAAVGGGGASSGGGSKIRVSILDCWNGMVSTREVPFPMAMFPTAAFAHLGPHVHSIGEKSARPPVACGMATTRAWLFEACKTAEIERLLCVRKERKHRRSSTKWKTTEAGFEGTIKAVGLLPIGWSVRGSGQQVTRAIYSFWRHLNDGINVIAWRAALLVL
jgi:hypothetical protein